MLYIFNIIILGLSRIWSDANCSLDLADYTIEILSKHIFIY